MPRRGPGLAAPGRHPATGTRAFRRRRRGRGLGQPASIRGLDEPASGPGPLLPQLGPSPCALSRGDASGAHVTVGSVASAAHSTLGRPRGPGQAHSAPSAAGIKFHGPSHRVASWRRWRTVSLLNFNSRSSSGSQRRTPLTSSIDGESGRVGPRVLTNRLDQPLMRDALGVALAAEALHIKPLSADDQVGSGSGRHDLQHTMLQRSTTMMLPRSTTMLQRSIPCCNEKPCLNAAYRVATQLTMLQRS